MKVSGWVAECNAPSPGICRLMGWQKSALLFKTRQDAREFVRQWREDTKDNAPIKVRQVDLKAKQEG